MATNRSRIVCAICLEDDLDTRIVCRLACDHYMCESCVVEAFTSATSTEYRHPAKCCTTPLPRSLAESILSTEAYQCWMTRVNEYAVPIRQRTYCADPNCGQFLPPRVGRSEPLERCGECMKITCSTCKDAAILDQPHICRARNAQDADFIQQMTAQGCKQCPCCKVMINLHEACNHIECSMCKYQFCFVCLRSWEGFHADCPQYGQPTADENGFFNGYHLQTGLDAEGYNRTGYNSDGLDRNGNTRAESTTNAGANAPPAAPRMLQDLAVRDYRFRARLGLPIITDQVLGDDLLMQQLPLTQAGFALEEEENADLFVDDGLQFAAEDESESNEEDDEEGGDEVNSDADSEADWDAFTHRWVAQHPIHDTAFANPHFEGLHQPTENDQDRDPIVNGPPRHDNTNAEPRERLPGLNQQRDESDDEWDAELASGAEHIEDVANELEERAATTVDTPHGQRRPRIGEAVDPDDPQPQSFLRGGVAWEPVVRRSLSSKWSIGTSLFVRPLRRHR